MNSTVVHTLVITFLQALAAAFVTAGVGYGLNRIPVTRDFISTKRRHYYAGPAREDYITAMILAFLVTLVIDWMVLGFDWFAFEGIGWIALLAVSFAAVGLFSLVVDSDHDRLGWGFRVSAIGFLAMICAAFWIALSA